MPYRFLVPVALLAAAVAPMAGQTAGGSGHVRQLLETVAKNIGADTLTTLQYSGGGMVAAVGQAFNPSEGFPPFTASNYSRVIDYAAMASREEYVRQLPVHGRPFGALLHAGGETGNESSPPGNRGGGQQAVFVKPVQMRLLVNGAFAWNIQGEGAPAVRQFEYLGGADAGELRQLEIILTPHGFVKAALAQGANPELVRGNIVTFRALGKYTVTGTIGPDHLVTVVRTWVPSPVVGDMLVESRYTEYQTYGRVKFPRYIHSHQGDLWVLGSGGHDSHQYRITSVAANVEIPAGTLAVPPAVQAAQPPPVRAESEPLATGVWLIGGSGAHSVLVEFRDFAAIVEAPGNDARSQAVIAEVKRLVPGKPIRYVVNTHAHWDHAGGLRGYVAEGATIVTHEENVPFYRTAMFDRSSWTLMPDTLAKLRAVMPIQPQFVGVDRRYLLTDRQWGTSSAVGSRVLELYHLWGSPPSSHNEWNLVAYLPAEGILINADLAGAPPEGPSPAQPAEGHLFLNGLIRTNRLNVVRHVPIHGRPYSHEAFVKYVGDRVPYSSVPAPPTGTQ